MTSWQIVGSKITFLGAYNNCKILTDYTNLFAVVNWWLNMWCSLAWLKKHTEKQQTRPYTVGHTSLFISYNYVFFKLLKPVTHKEVHTNTYLITNSR